MTEATKTQKNKYIIFKVLSIILTVLPLVIFLVIAFVNGEPHQKLTLGCMTTLAAILTGMNIMFKYEFRSSIWLLLLGIYVCLDNITPLLIVLAVCTIVDEMIITPLYKKYKGLYTINKEIDKRG